jgi:UDP-3-O-[3-hydroxymyristoyl] N-acetylglucosamine deacetylase
MSSTPSYQRTLARTVSTAGVGVHSGVRATLTLHPADSDTGIRFRRTDKPSDQGLIQGIWSNVNDTRLCTVLTNSHGVSVSTVEHLMAAFAALDIDNALVELDGPEMPIMDGSAEPFIALIDEAGTKADITAPRRAIKILKTVTYTEGDKQATLSPGQDRSFGLSIDFNSAAIAHQDYRFTLSNRTFRDDIAEARTFGFLPEVEALRKMGLARGGNLDNTIVVDGDRVLNPDGLRFENEFVRHKLLDAVGDLALAGLPILGHFQGLRSGHGLNNKLLRALFADPSAYELVPFVASTDVTAKLSTTNSPQKRAAVAHG